MRCLIVEDEVSWATLLLVWLQRTYGNEIDVTIARTFYEATKRLDETWDLVVCDYMLDGVATCEQLLQGRMPLPVVIVSGIDPAAAARLASALGCEWCTKDDEKKARVAFERVVAVTHRPRSGNRVPQTTPSVAEKLPVPVGLIFRLLSPRVRVVGVIVSSLLVVIAIASAVIAFGENRGTVAEKLATHSSLIEHLSVDAKELHAVVDAGLAERRVFEVQMASELNALRREVRMVLGLPELERRRLDAIRRSLDEPEAGPMPDASTPPPDQSREVVP